MALGHKEAGNLGKVVTVDGLERLGGLAGVRPESERLEHVAHLDVALGLGPALGEVVLAERVSLAEGTVDVSF